jgi:antitoxin component of RelBE/YafQ-DinJ toxin-antitoxin module
MANESGLRIRVDSTLRGEFLQCCHEQDLTAAQVLRSYMRDFVGKNHALKQSELFDRDLGEKNAEHTN